MTAAVVHQLRSSVRAGDGVAADGEVVAYMTERGSYQYPLAGGIFLNNRGSPTATSSRHRPLPRVSTNAARRMPKGPLVS